MDEINILKACLLGNYSKEFDMIYQKNLIALACKENYI